jgi:hypothetical protein
MVNAHSVKCISDSEEQCFNISILPRYSKDLPY